jgi:uncharacterized protein YvpB
MKLNVPLVRQAEGSPDCGVACLAMLLNYYGVEHDYKKIRKEIGVLRWGTTTPQLGLWLLKHGFDVEIVTMHPKLFNIYSKFSSKRVLLKHLKSFRGKYKKLFDRIALEHFIQFVAAGGTLTPHVPTMSDVKKELKAKRPVMSLLTHWFLHKSKLGPRFTLHFNIISGLDKRFVYVNDPDWDLMGGAHKHKIEDYMYAVYASAFPALDNASFMKVKMNK